ncbi:MAG: DUF1611 domain-containing protein [Alphaproteobacteria bacterium]|nr:DUF1611 domain-containing protein [Alphaproteobacteria bacterium]
MSSTSIEAPYLMYLGDAPDQLAAKTANGVKVWRPEKCRGQFRLPGCNADLGLPDMTMKEAADHGVRTIILGVANRGGVMPDAWVDTLVEGLELGMDIASGLHVRVSQIQRIKDCAAANGRKVLDVRHPTKEFDLGTGAKRPGKRLLTVGTDCSVGKMFTSLAIEAEMKKRGMKADFRATGQTGIFIAGDGVSVDAVIADFIAGAAEWLSPANDEDHWDLMEGQGSLLHASFAGVSMGLLHGSQPDALVLCHEVNRPHMRGLPHYPVPSLEEALEINMRCARLTNPDAKLVGVALNTQSLSDQEAEDALKDASDRLGVPAIDAVRTGAAAIVDAL